MKVDERPQGSRSLCGMEGPVINRKIQRLWMPDQVGHDGEIAGQVVFDVVELVSTTFLFWSSGSSSRHSCCSINNILTNSINTRF